MNEKDPKVFRLPYHVDLELLDKIFGELKNTGSEGIKQDTLWLNVGKAKDSNRSYTLNLAKYLGLIETDASRVILTKLGIKCIRFATGDDRRTILAKFMPLEYLAMFKWIQGEQEMKSNEIKQKYIEAWDQPQSTIVLDKAIAAFLNYCQYLKLLKYMGKGNQARAVITDFGKNVLDSASQTESTMSQSENKNDDRQMTDTNTRNIESINLPKDAAYPIMIKTNDRDFSWDVKSDTDWTVIDSVIRSIREGWEKTHQKPKEAGQ